MIGSRGIADTTVKHNVRRHTSAIVLERRKASASHRRTGVRDALDGLQRLQIQAIVIVVGHDQVRLVRTTDKLHSHGIHILLNVRGRDSGTAVGQARIGNRLPERERRAVDTAVGTRRRRIRDRSAQAGNVLTAVAGAVQIDVAADTVGKLSLRNVHTAIQKVDDGFLAGVLDHFQTGDSHRRGILSDRELSSRNGAVLRHVQHFIAAIAIGVVRAGIIVHDFLQDDVTAAEGLHIAAFLQTTKKRVIVSHVVGQFTTAALNVGRNDVADRAIGESHC